MASAKEPHLHHCRAVSWGVRFPDQPTVGHLGDDGSVPPRMGDEGCPNEGSSVDDATGYSREEEEIEAMTGEEGP